MGHLITIPADDAALITDERVMKPVSLERAQALVGGYVELLNVTYTSKQRRDHPAQMLVNEEGLLRNMAFNARASDIAKRTIVGPAVVLLGEAKWR